MSIVNPVIPTATEKRTGLEVSSTPIVLSGTEPLLLGGGRRWHLQIVNLGGLLAENISSVRIRRRATPGAPWSPWENITLSTALSSGTNVSIRETDDASDALDVELSCASGDTTTAAVHLVAYS
jgi:hypothetical protein